MNRRKWVLGLSGLGITGLAYRYWPEDGLINPSPRDQAEVLSKIRDHNPLLFDFVLKRALVLDGNSFGAAPFHARVFFELAGANV